MFDPVHTPGRWSISGGNTTNTHGNIKNHVCEKPTRAAFHLLHLTRAQELSAIGIGTDTSPCHGTALFVGTVHTVLVYRYTALHCTMYALLSQVIACRRLSTAFKSARTPAGVYPDNIDIPWLCGVFVWRFHAC